MNRWELSPQTDAAKRRISSKGHPLALSSQGSSALLLRVSRSGEPSPGRGQRGTKGLGKDQTVSADKPHPLHSVPLACATTAISRGLGIRVAGAPRRVEAATEEKEAVGVIPSGRGQWRTKVHTLLSLPVKPCSCNSWKTGFDHDLSLVPALLKTRPGRVRQERDVDGRSVPQTLASAAICAPYARAVPPPAGPAPTQHHHLPG